MRLLGALCSLSMLAGCVGPAPVPCTPCGSQCVDVKSDSANCGSCGNACADGQVCRDGSCQSNCPSAESSCNGLCVDTQTDPANCGGCGISCAPGQACQAGGCLPNCGAPLSLCDMACVDEATDPDHCGGCGVKCFPDHAVAAACVHSLCSYSQCLSGFADCDGTLANGCETDVELDTYNCGGCQAKCVPAHVVRLLSDGGYPDAGTTDGGACGELPDGGDAGACPPVVVTPPPGAICSAGTCGYQACEQGYADCDTVTSNGCETFLLADPMHCGACGVQCATGQSCVAGSCQ